MGQIAERLLPEFPISPSGLQDAYGEIEAFVGQAGLPQSLALKLCVILDEVYANLNRHDSSVGSDDVFGLTFMPTNERERGDTLSVQIWDSGKAFDPIAQPAAEGADLGGQGLRLIKGLASTVSYARRDGRNVLDLTLRHLE